MEARLLRHLEWIISMEIPEWDFTSSASLGEWLRGSTPLIGDTSLRVFEAGGMQFSSNSRGTLSLLPPFWCNLNSGGALFAFEGALSGSSPFIELNPEEVSEKSLRSLLLGQVAARATRLRFDGSASETASIFIGANEGIKGFDLLFDKPVSLSLEAFDSESGRAGAVLIEGSGTIRMDTLASFGQSEGGIRLERVSFLGNSSAECRRIAIAGQISRLAHMVHIAGGQACIAGNNEVLYLETSDSIVSQAQVGVVLYELWLPVCDADFATVEFSGKRIDLVIPGRLASHNSVGASQAPQGDASRLLLVSDPIVSTPQKSADAEQTGDMIVLGQGGYLISETSGAVFRFRRGADLFNLTFTFAGFNVVVQGGKAWLERPVPRKRTDPFAPAGITVDFPPQHIAEEWYLEPTGTEPKFGDVIRARMSSASRVVFSVDCDRKRALWAKRLLTIEELTEWNNLTLEVHPRALPANASFDSQLNLVGIVPSTALKDALDKVQASLTPPNAGQTQLELTGRLIFSPSVEAGWLTPREINLSAAPLWYARLDGTGRRSVRAIWSRYMTTGSFPQFGDQAGDSLLLLVKSNHWDLVGQSSVYGLPALRRIIDKPQDANDPVEKQLKDLPQGRVIRVVDDTGKDYQMLVDMDQAKNYKEKDSGIAIPAPFEDADVMLTSLGGIVSADWVGEPPSLFAVAPEDPGFQEWKDYKTPQSFVVEKYQQETYLGREILVEIVTKGFLCCCGLRSSFVELTERLFFRHPRFSSPYAFLVKRSFLVCHEREKRFPAINQPYLSRDFPVGRIVMLTKQTPDLVSPDRGDGDTVLDILPGNVEVTNGGRLTFPWERDNKANLKIFWPRVSDGLPGTPGDVEFKWTTDDDDKSLVSNFLFIDNQAVHIEPLMGQIVNLYRQLQNTNKSNYINLRTARLGGTRKRYAQSDSNGSTALDTDSWLLSTHGQLTTDNAGQETERFFMDGRMEGSDQPPFYPVVEQASVSIQTLEQLVGHPLGLITVGFNPTYVAQGFGPPNNPSDIYLNLLCPDIELNVTGQSTATGGFAQPNALAVALSRRIGIVGGRRKSTAPKLTGKTGKKWTKEALTFHFFQPQTSRPFEFSRAQSPASPYTFDKAQSGLFDPAEFLGGITEAKLLGLIKLGDVLKQVGIDLSPKLLETIGYGVPGAADGGLDRIKHLLFESADGGPGIGDRLKSGLQTIVTAVSQPIAVGSSAVHFSDIYPDLNAALQNFAQAFNTDLENIRKADNLASVAGAVTEIVVAGTPFVAQIERTLQDPVPPLVKGLIQGLSDAWGVLKDLVNGNFLAIGRDLASQLVPNAIQPICDAIFDSHLQEALMGVDSLVTCDEIIANPQDALNNVGASLFSEICGNPLLALLNTLSQYKSQVTGSIAWADRLITQSALSSLVDASEKIRSELTQPANDQEDGNILASPARVAMSVAINSTCKGKFSTLLGGTASAKSLDEVRTVVDSAIAQLPNALKDIGTDIKSSIQSQRNVFKAKKPADIDHVIDEFESAAIPGIIDALNKDLSTRLSTLRGQLITSAQQNRTEAILRIGQMAATAFQSMGALTLLAEVARAGQNIAHWCDAMTQEFASSSVVAFADNVASLLLGETGQISADVMSALQTSDLLELPAGLPSEISAKFDAAKRSIKSSIQQIAQTVQALDMARRRLAGIRSSATAVCSNPIEFIDVTRRLIDFPASCLNSISSIAAKAREIEQLIQQRLFVTRVQNEASGGKNLHAPVATTDLTATVHALVKNMATLVGEITSVGRVGQGPVWKDIQSVVDSITGAEGADTARFRDLNEIAGYPERLSDLVSSMTGSAGELRDALQDTNITTTDLQNFVIKALAYVQEDEKRFLAHILQSVTFPAAEAERLGKVAAAGIAALAGRLAEFHAGAVTALNQLLSVLTAPAVEPVMKIILADPNALDNFAAAISAVQNDETLLENIQKQGEDPANILAASTSLLIKWFPPGQQGKGPALVGCLNVFATFVETVMRGDLGDIISTAIKGAFQAILSDLKDALSQLLPTRVDIGYDFKTSLGEFPKDNYVFAMVNGESPEDLVISANVAVDFISGTRDVSIKGSLKPFEIWLVTESINIAKILFKAATFESSNGSVPSFHAEVDTVVLGPLMDFIKPLEAWLSPDSGFYVKPTSSPVGLDVGYEYDAGIMQVGALQFINVDIGVSARLPFNGDEAEFDFHFADKDKPFLIAYPPYGGGGFIQLIANAQSIKGFSLSFQFGAVVGIQFGPLEAQGRVTAGVFLSETENGGRIISAFVEAVGEGNLACFSICVMLEVGLTTDSEDGHSRLYGYTDFSFTFKAGFIGITLGFRAEYTIAGSAGSGQMAAKLRSGEANAAGAGLLTTDTASGVDNRRRYSSLVPRKESNWGDYRRYLAMDLL
ncbi:MAG: hypothetical protein JOZ08_01730 [Verrucomicrobia bacterium]|nr:hypothetical protein [Verrucomicrobiota bacterium]